MTMCNLVVLDLVLSHVDMCIDICTVIIINNYYFFCSYLVQTLKFEKTWLWFLRVVITAQVDIAQSETCVDYSV